MAHIAVRDEASSSIAEVANRLTYAGGTAALIGGLTATEIAAFGGLLVAFVGLLVQIYYKRKEDRRQIEQHTDFMSKMRLPRDSE